MTQDSLPSVNTDLSTYTSFNAAQMWGRKQITERTQLEAGAMIFENLIKSAVSIYNSENENNEIEQFFTKFYIFHKLSQKLLETQQTTDRFFRFKNVVESDILSSKKITNNMKLSKNSQLQKLLDKKESRKDRKERKIAALKIGRDIRSASYQAKEGYGPQGSKLMGKDIHSATLRGYVDHARRGEEEEEEGGEEEGEGGEENAENAENALLKALLKKETENIQTAREEGGEEGGEEGEENAENAENALLKALLKKETENIQTEGGEEEGEGGEGNAENALLTALLKKETDNIQTAQEGGEEEGNAENALLTALLKKETENNQTARGEAHVHVGGADRLLTDERKKGNQNFSEEEVTNFINYFIKITYELYEKVIIKQLPQAKVIQDKFMKNYLKKLYSQITPKFIEIVIDNYEPFVAVATLVTRIFEINITSQLDNASLSNDTYNSTDPNELKMGNVVFAYAQEKYISFLIKSYTEHDYVKQRIGQTNGIRNIQKYLEDKFDEIFGIEQRNERVENFKLEKVLNALFSNPTVRTKGFRSQIQKIDEAIDGFTNIRALQGIINDILGKENAISLTDGQIRLGMQFPADKEDDQAEIDKLVKSVKILSHKSQVEVVDKLEPSSPAATSVSQ